MLGAQLVKSSVVPRCLAGVLLAGGWAAAAEPTGSVHIGDSYCPPAPPFMMPPALPVTPPYYPVPYDPAPFAPGQPMFMPPGSGHPPVPGMPGQPSPQQPQTSQQPAAPQQPQAVAPAQATPTFTPSTTAATAPQATAPNMVGDFFGPTTAKPIILPRDLVNQAIFRDPIPVIPTPPPKGSPPDPPAPLLDYFRIVTLVDPTTNLYETASDVLLGSGKSGVASASLSELGEQLLTQYDGTQFTGDKDDLGPVTDNRKFVAFSSGTLGNVLLLAPEDPMEMTTLMNEPIFNIFDTAQVFVPAPGATVGRQKIAENNSVFPRDRMFFNYSGFTNVPLSATGENVHRYVPGFELAFLQEQMSVEFRLPFAATLDSNIRAGGLTSRNEVELGNAVATLKALVSRTRNTAVAVGATMSFPTASDVTVQDFFGNEIIAIENHSVHAMPFIGAAYFEGRWWAQSFVQGDIDTSGNRVLLRNENTGDLEDAGDLYNSSFLYASASIGYWLYQNGYTNSSFLYQQGRQIKRRVSAHDTWITGFAPMAELHFNRSLEGGEMVMNDNYQVCLQDQFSLTNLVLGGLMTFGTGGSVNVSWSTPIIGRDDRQFDHEVRVWLQYAL